MPSIAFVITTPPTENFTITALSFIKESIKKNIDVKGVFFYQQGVLNASCYMSPPSDEVDVLPLWQSLVEQHRISLYLCATAAEKYGLLDDMSLAQKSPELSSNIAPEFTVSGLTELVELTLKADRVVQL